jgi:hypothetical protein
VQHCASSDMNAEDAERKLTLLRQEEVAAVEPSLETQCVAEHEPEKGSIMAKRKKRSKVQKRAKLRRGHSAARGKARRASTAARAKATKRTVARAKPKREPVKRAARKEVRRMKQPVAPAVETVAVEVIEQPAPGVITVTEVEEATEVRQVS